MKKHLNVLNPFGLCPPGLFLLFSLLSAGISSNGQVADDYRTRASGNWNAIATWQRYDGSNWINVTGTGVNTIPNSGDGAITILSGHTVTVSANATVDQVTVNAGGQITVSANRTLTIANGAAAIDMLVNGTINNAWAITTTGTLSFGANSNYIHSRNGGSIPTATWNASSTCTVTGIVGSALSGLGQSFGNFTWNCTSQNANRNFGGSLTTVNGNFTVISTNGEKLYMTDNTDLAMTIAGDLVVSGGDLSFVEDNNTDITLNVSGNINISGGDLRFSDGNGSTAIVNAGDFSISGGDVVFATGNNSVATLTVSDLTLSGSGDLTFNNANNSNATLQVNGNFLQSNGSLDFSSASQIGVLTMNVTGNFSQTGGNFDFASGNSSVARMPVLNLSGDFTQTGSATIETSTGSTQITNGTITFAKNGTQTFSIVSQSNVDYINFTVAASSILQLNSNLTLSSISTPTWAGIFTVNANGTLDARNHQVLSAASTGVNNSFILSSGATIITSNTYGLQSGTNGTISTSLANRTFSSGANYQYNGTAIQNSGVFTTSPTANQVNNLTVNNTGGGTGLTLQQPLAVAGTCFFTAGRITTTATNILTFKDNAIASGANNAMPNPSYVNGPVRKIGNDAFIFPVGKSNVGYMACGISSPGNTTDAFTAEYFRNSAIALGPITAPGLYHLSACEYWQLDRTTGTSAVNVTLSWSGLSPCNAGAYVTDLASLVVVHFNGSSWDAYGNNGGATGNGAAGTVTWNNVSTFSPFTLGSITPVTNPLPVKFSEIKAYRVADGNKIEWKNLTETGLARYEVERSGNGTVFSPISNVMPRSNSGSAQAYSVTDENTPDGTNYYRIKAIEMGGSAEYSAIVKVQSVKNEKSDLSVYPNPVNTAQFTIQLNNYQRGNYNLQLISAGGQQVMNRSLQHAGGSAAITLDRPGSVTAGIYLLRVSDGQTVATMKLVIN